jgi:hypothetical protein
MKINNRLKNTIFLLMAICTVIICQYLGEVPTQATIPTVNQIQLSELNNLNGLEVEYLPEKTSFMIADSELMDNSITAAEEAVAVMPEDLPVKFPLGTNSRIRITQVDSEGQKTILNKVEAVAFINNDGETTNFTPMWMGKMFAVEKANNGKIVVNADSEELSITDASGDYNQSRRVPNMNIVVRDRVSDRKFVLKHLSANGICQDALFAVVNHKLRRL